MTKTIKLSMACAVIFTSLQGQTVELSPIKITSTAIKTNELTSTDSVEVYTQKDIENSHSKNIYDFLNTNTSVFSIASYGNPFVQLIDMRGYGLSNGFQNIVVTIDRKRINNIDNSPQILSSIALESVAKIEIIKSSGVVTNGDGSNAGAINIITKYSNQKEFSFFGGNKSTFGSSFNYSNLSDDSFLSVIGSTQKTDGTRKIDADGKTDENKKTNLSVKYSYIPSEAVEFRLSSSISRLDVLYGGTMSEAQYQQDPSQFSGFTSHQKIKTDAISSGFTYNINSKLSLKADAYVENKESDYIPSYGPRNYNSDSANVSLDYVDDLLSISLGYDVFYGDREQGANLTEKNNEALFLQSVLNFSSNTLKLGVRYENVEYKHKDNSADLTKDEDLYGAEIGYNFLINKNNSLFVSYSHAYQAPNVDMFFSTSYDPITYAPSTNFNQFIEPMKTDSITLGYNKINKSNKLKISLYYTKLKDEIYLYKNAANPFDFGTNTNIDESHKYGFDLYNKYIVSDNFNTTLNYNYTKAIIDDEIGSNNEKFTDKELPGVSDHSIKLSLSYLPNSNSSITLTQVYKSEAYASDDFSNSFSQKQDAYNSTNLNANYSKDNWEVFAKINNLFENENGLWIKDDAIYPVNFARTFYAGLKLKY
jgi:iron complex outermembrane receptor protein